MKLVSARIHDYRSIADAVISFQPSCRILIGMNEAGKSNILHALALLDPQRTPAPDDLRETYGRPAADRHAFVRFAFDFDKNDMTAILKHASAKTVSHKVAQRLVTSGSTEFTLSDLVRGFCYQGVYTVSIPSGQRQHSTWALPADVALIPGWKVPSPAAPPSYPIALPDGQTVPLRSAALIHVDCLHDCPSAYVADAEPSHIGKLLGSAAMQVMQQAEMPSCLLWSYRPELLLPARIPIDAFAGTPGTCEPLRAMFALAGHGDIAADIAEARTRTNGLANLLEHVAVATTKHIRKVWKEYPDIDVSLSLNGQHIDAAVRDKINRYDFARRSDGFKRFVSFVILVSSQAHTGHLRNALILYDEPDMSLHPSGARFLRDELLRIAEQNIVVFSTHSIFMIDGDHMARHIVVTKANEVTSLNAVSASNIASEEVLYNAVGWSLFAGLKKSNIVFEGWRDYCLFRAALRFCPKKHGRLRTVYKKLGACYAQGVSDIGRVAAVLTLAERSFVIVSDADDAARQAQRAYRGDARWMRYDELLSNVGKLTGEDFLRADVVAKCVIRQCEDVSAPYAFTEDSFKDNRPRLSVIRAWLVAGGCSTEKQKDYIERIKTDLFESLGSGCIEPRYYEVLEALAGAVAEMKPS